MLLALRALTVAALLGLLGSATVLAQLPGVVEPDEPKSRRIPPPPPPTAPVTFEAWVYRNRAEQCPVLLEQDGWRIELLCVYGRQYLHVAGPFRGSPIGTASVEMPAREWRHLLVRSDGVHTAEVFVHLVDVRGLEGLWTRPAILGGGDVLLQSRPDDPLGRAVVRGARFDGVVRPVRVVPWFRPLAQVVRTTRSGPPPRFLPIDASVELRDEAAVLPETRAFDSAAAAVDARIRQKERDEGDRATIVALTRAGVALAFTLLVGAAAYRLVSARAV
jgi:hypothetical protein